MTETSESDPEAPKSSCSEMADRGICLPPPGDGGNSSSSAEEKPPVLVLIEIAPTDENDPWG